MPVPTKNSTIGLMEALKKTIINDQGLIDELHKLQTYSSPSMFCRFHNQSLVAGVSINILYINFLYRIIHKSGLNKLLNSVLISFRMDYM